MPSAGADKFGTRSAASNTGMKTLWYIRSILFKSNSKTAHAYATLPRRSVPIVFHQTSADSPDDKKYRWKPRQIELKVALVSQACI